jgi:hypothetical protein
MVATVWRSVKQRVETLSSDGRARLLPSRLDVSRLGRSLARPADTKDVNRTAAP